MKTKRVLLFFAAILFFSLTIVPTLSVGAEDPWKVLDGFTPVPRSLTRVGERYVGMLFVNRDEQLIAAVIFNATCVRANCRLNHRAAYAVANAEGSSARLYVEPKEKELMEMMGSIYVGYSGSGQVTAPARAVLDLGPVAVQSAWLFGVNP